MTKGIVLSVTLTAAFVVGCSPAAPVSTERAPSAAAASGEAPHLGEGGLPQFAKDNSWPKVPAEFKLGFGSHVTGDSEGHVWILSRPRNLGPLAKDPRKVGPPVMEFDQDGNYIQGWGGQSGPGYQWPSNEHGISVDTKGFVWIIGNADGTSNNPDNLPNDNQVLKFTKDGKFVMAIGKSGQTGSNKTEVLKGATSVFHHAKTNEVFVTDGYGNARVMVYDGDTGAFKRMWGAYGNKPLDEADRPKKAALSPVPYVSLSESLQQFASPVHDVKVSNDDLVYVCDRGNKRIQVFKLDGTFVAEQFMGLDNPAPLQVRGVAFSPDQKLMYLGGVPVVYVLNRKTLEVLGKVTISETLEGRQPGHLLGTDNAGNLYVAAEYGQGEGKGGPGAFKFRFTGFSPAVTGGN